MRTCEDDSDCRGGAYRCVDTTGDQSRRVVDRNPSTQRICAIPSPIETGRPPDPPVCFPSDASFDVNRPEAGPIVRDARAETDDGETDRDGADDSSDTDAGDAEPGVDAAPDALDADRVETGADGDDAAGDAEPDVGDATSDPAEASLPDAADAADAEDPADVSDAPSEAAD